MPSLADRDYGLLTGETGRVEVMAQFAKRDNAEGTGPECGAPRPVTLLVTRRETNLPRAKHPGQFAGDILTVIVEEFNWAEYGHEAYCGDNHWLTENYRMQILSLVGLLPDEPLGWGRMHG